MAAARWIAAIILFAAVFYVLGHLSPFGATWWLLIGIALTVKVLGDRGTRRRRLLDDAHLQHRALMDGDERTGVFGRYPAVGAWRDGESPLSAEWIKPVFTPPWLIITEDPSGLTETRIY